MEVWNFAAPGRDVASKASRSSSASAARSCCQPSSPSTSRQAAWAVGDRITWRSPSRSEMGLALGYRPLSGDRCVAHSRATVSDSEHVAPSDNRDDGTLQRGDGRGRSPCPARRVGTSSFLVDGPRLQGGQRAIDAIALWLALRNAASSAEMQSGKLVASAFADGHTRKDRGSSHPG